ncbi:hypothetical protein QAD02_000196 [Eretmocerus hayati]|uniref:Uncharacterized protein n=1 Tax=Eretmocerus hayati TaxID=131215 RepID=A0ACC2NFA8_9HYME|nr:hypothetical protein QAD02_000196 [Eretmocerus hayati]
MSQPAEDAKSMQKKSITGSEAKTSHSGSKDSTPPRHCCAKELPVVEKIDCCAEKRRKAEEEQNKKVTVWVHGPPCENIKQERIPRHCMTSDEYLDFLAEPAKKCDPGCAKIPVERRLRPVSPRIVELARPPKRRIALTLAERACVMPPDMIDRLATMLEQESALTPEQAENLLRDQEAQKKCPKKQRRHFKKGKCPPEPRCPSSALNSRKRKRRKKRGKLMEAGDPSIDVDAASCQYNMAVKFVRSILNWRCSVSKNDYRDIAEVILERLSEQLGYKPLDAYDRRSQQMRVLSDVLACWISGILMQLAERHKAEVQVLCEQRRREQEEEEAALEQQRQEEDDDSADNASCELDDDQLNELDADMQSTCLSITQASLSKSCVDSEVDATNETADKDSQYADGGGLGADGVLGMSRSGLDGEGGLENQESQTLQSGVGDGVDTGVQLNDGDCDPDALKKCMAQLEAMASKVYQVTDTDVPFLTLSSILDALFCMIECQPENMLCDPTVNRLHRAIYEKLEGALNCGGGDLDSRAKDVLDVVTGKLAIWIAKTMSESETRALCEQPAEVESLEIRDWSKWLSEVASLAEDWSGWIGSIANEADCIRKKGNTTRGDWQNWTKEFESNALLWRRTYLEATHQQHHNTMMMKDRQVVKSKCSRKTAIGDESTIKSTHF